MEENGKLKKRINKIVDIYCQFLSTIKKLGQRGL
jgi:hypothetical protein